MLSVVSAGIGGMDRLAGTQSDAAELERALALEDERQLRRRSAQRDFELNLPHSIPLSDEHPYRTNFIARDKVLKQWIQPPPNRTVYDAESPPAYRPSKGLKSTSASSISSLTSSVSANRHQASPLSLPPSNSISNYTHSSRTSIIPCPGRCLTSTSSLSSSSISSTSPSSNYNHNQNSSSNGNKTDFLQKTVKIFSGKKSHNSTRSLSPNPSTSSSIS